MMNVQDAVLTLNSMLQADERAISAVMLSRHPCNDELANHSSCVVAPYRSGNIVGTVGILNGIFGQYSNQVIAVEVDEKDPTLIVQFTAQPKNEWILSKDPKGELED